MYRRLEPKPEIMKADESTTKGTCTCTCKTGQAKEDSPLAAGNHAKSETVVHYEISGKVLPDSK